MELPKYLTTITPFSKYLALSLFIVLPLITFVLGYDTGRSIPSNSSDSSVKVNNSPYVQDKGNYKIYTNRMYQYTVQFPTNLDATEEDYPFSVLFGIKQKEPGPGGFPVFYISVIPADQNGGNSIYNREPKEIIDKFFNTGIGQKIDTAPNITSTGYDFNSFTELPNILIDGKNAIVVENDKVWEGGNGLKDRRVLVKKNNNIYMLGSYYTTSADLDNFNQFISTFRFTN